MPRSLIDGSNKILTLEALADRVAQLRADGFKVVMCHGVFDLLHIGHIRHFRQARKFGNVLVVSVTPDRFVNKGTHRPAFSEVLRAEAVEALGVVDYVTVNAWPTAVETLRLIRPDVYCKGSEYQHVQGEARVNLLAEIRAASEAGARVEYTEDIVFSSSQLLNRHFSLFPPKTDAWLRKFRERYSAEEVIRYLEDAVSLRPLVIGEAIIDEYVFCETIGKSTKDPILACKYLSTEAFAGGSLAVANHLAGFCKEVGLVSFLGETERREEFLNQALLPNVRPVFLTRRGVPTIHKRRFVDQYAQNKLLELYVMNDRAPVETDEQEMLAAFNTAAPDHDVIIAADYGHGMMTPSLIATLCDAKSFLAVNTQSNAGNRGFNTISKYRRADYVCLAGHEIQIETRLREGNTHDLLLEVARRIDCPRFTVTHGKHGSLHYERDAGFIEVPALAMLVTDRVGAGDAVLALTSLLVAQGAPWDVVGFVGNVTGAQMVAELGNRVSVNKASLTKHIISLMK